MAIRSAAKAIVLHNDHVLVNRYANSEYGVFYDLPGGGQKQYETMEDAVIREVLEETGYHVVVERFLALAEEIYDSPSIRQKYPNSSHRILHIFLVRLSSETPQDATEPDLHQEESIWVPLEEADRLSFHPTLLNGRISSLILERTPQYLGAVRMP